MGYDAENTDPLYKFLPFYITYNREHRASFGLFYDIYCDSAIDFGKEMDNYHGPYRYFTTTVDNASSFSNLDYYFIAGP